MSIWIELLLLAAVIVYIVDVSGWTDTWLGWLSKFTARHGYPPVKSLRPFSCSKCMTWWCCLLWAYIRKEFTLPVVAYIAGLSLLSVTIQQALIFIAETLTNAIVKVKNWLND